MIYLKVTKGSNTTAKGFTQRLFFQQKKERYQYSDYVDITSISGFVDKKLLVARK